jgi:hypothetical protein
MKDAAQIDSKRLLTKAEQEELDKLSPSDRAVYEQFFAESGNHSRAMKNLYAPWC